MEPTALDFFEQALQTPSPSGYEEPLQRLVRRYIEPHADATSIDVHGNLIATLCPADQPATSSKSTGDSDSSRGPRLMYAGHCDQIGMLVSHIDDDGFVYGQTIGGWDPQQLIGQAMTIWTQAGPVSAVISRKAIHLLTPEERKQVVQLNQMWLDVGAVKGRPGDDDSMIDGDTVRNAIRIGDPVTLELGMRRLLGDQVTGPGMDNKTGMWTVIDALRRVAADRDGLNCELNSVSTVQEEIGLRGAKTAAGHINPDVAIAVDVTHATDCPGIDKNTQGDVRVGGGPVIFRGPNINAKVAQRLIDLCQSNDLPYQLAALGRAAPNDSNVLQIHGGGVATGLVGVPNRYMHSAVEVVSLSDIDHVAELLKCFALALEPDDDFIPG
ncbi:M42 family metallopeptidase [Crateriforma conspicua]|uniref:Putative aminopeptidase YsdC n=1 Tax=Crateriforma conspicua TaxID=2527996 RepID=A0A5C6FUG4_9PLAN|nr:M42 family metallopeptidase [Crateriforma conspicua]TWU66569.1 putative aminopeptidase YsdC [Crateriforma conspicua]